MRGILAAVALFAMSPACSLFGQNPPCASPVNFAGIRTFLSAPYVPRLEDLKADIAVVGEARDMGRANFAKVQQCIRCVISAWDSTSLTAIG